MHSSVTTDVMHAHHTLLWGGDWCLRSEQFTMLLVLFTFRTHPETVNFTVKELHSKSQIFIIEFQLEIEMDTQLVVAQARSLRTQSTSSKWLSGKMEGRL